MKAPSPLHPLAGRRILLVQQVLELGGAERQGILYARYLKEVCGAEVALWGFDKPGLVTTLCEEAGIPWRLEPCVLAPSAFTRLRNILRFALAVRRAKIEVLLPYTMPPNVVCGIGWRWSGARTCIWNQQDEGRQRLGRFWEHWAVKATPMFVSNATAGATFLTQEFHLPAKRLRIIGNGIAIPQPENDRAAWRQRLGLSIDTPVACMVANLHSGKDHATLLDAWRRVLDQAPPGPPPPVLLLAGRPVGTENALQEQAARLGLGATLRFLGTVKEVGSLLSTVDLMIHSSIHEGCPNAVQEAMALGVAVVGTDIPGMRDALGASADPFLAAPKDPEALAGRILSLLYHPQARAAAGRANLERIRDECDPGKVYGEMTDLIVSLCRRTSGPKTHPTSSQ